MGKIVGFVDTRKNERLGLSLRPFEVQLNGKCQAVGSSPNEFLEMHVPFLEKKAF